MAPSPKELGPLHGARWVGQITIAKLRARRLRLAVRDLGSCLGSATSLPCDTDPGPFKLQL